MTLPVDIVQLIPETYDADYDDDGDVDGFDFLKWQIGQSPLPLSDFDLNLWETQFGMPLPLAVSATTVPEPATWIILTLGIMGMLAGGVHARG